MSIAADGVSRAADTSIVMCWHTWMHLFNFVENFKLTFINTPYDESSLGGPKIKEMLSRREQEGKTLSAVGIRFPIPQRTFFKNQKRDRKLWFKKSQGFRPDTLRDRSSWDRGGFNCRCLLSRDDLQNQGF